MGKDFKKIGREMGRVDRVQAKKAQGQTVRCIHCRVLNTKTTQSCWKCGAEL